jgi:hypothetical protein
LSQAAGLKIETLERESRARCVRRWCALGLTRQEALELTDEPKVGLPALDLLPSADQPVRLIQGVLGSGKSLFGERWHSSNLERYRHVMGAPIPVYFEKRPREGQLQEAILREALELGDLIKCGVAVVIDDQWDEGSASPLQILEEARYLAEVWPASKFVVLHRPSPELSRQAGAGTLPPLSVDEATNLIERLGGFLSYQNIHSLERALQQPLFTILLALASRRPSDAIPRSRGELLNLLVRDVLTRSKTFQSGFQEDLERLGVAVFARGGPVPAAEIFSPKSLLGLVNSGLIFQENGTLRFSLDIFQEWFAAQALASGHAKVEEIAVDHRLLERWFFALAMYVAQASHNDASALLVILVRCHPTLASRVVQEALHEDQARALREEDATQPPPFDECGRRLRQAMQSWAQALGPLGQLISPLDGENEVLPVGIVVGQSIYVRSWYRGVEKVPPIIQLPRRLVDLSPFHDLNRDFPTYEWPALKWDKVGFTSAWAWEATREELSGQLAEVIRKRAFPLEKGSLLFGPLWKEMIWASALMVMNYGSGWMKPILLEKVDARIERYFSDCDMVSSSSKGPFSIRLLKEELARLRSQGERELSPLYPGCDEYSPNGWLRHPQTGEKIRPEPYMTVGSCWWDNFTDDGLAIHVSAIYSAALLGYEQLVQTWLPTLAPHLSTAALLPARLVGVVEHPSYRIGLAPGITWHLEPLMPSDRNKVEISAWRPRHENDRRPHQDVGEMFRQHYSLRPNSAQWIVGIVSSESVSSNETPATELAYRWLANDLKQVGWI